MTLIDYVVLAIVGFSVLLSVLRGFVRELLALAAWAVAFIVARLFGGDLAAIMPAEIPGEELRWLAGFVTLFLSVLLVMGLIAVSASQLIKSAGLSVEDRLLGVVFGVVRGAAVVIALALVAGATSLPQQPVWREAALRPLLELVASGVKGWLPPALAQHIKYS